MKPPKNNDYKTGVSERNNNYHVNIVNCNTYVHIQCCQGWTYSPDESVIVTPPNWFDRLLGYTYESMISDAIDRVQGICDKKNRIVSETDKLVKYHMDLM